MSEHKTRHRRSINAPGHAHELTFSCAHGLPLLQREEFRQILADSISQARKRLNFSLWAFVFMPNHAHLIVHSQLPEYEISDWLKAIKLPVSRKALAILRRESDPVFPRLKQIRGKKTEYHFWQRGGGYDRNVIDGKTLLKMIDYIHLNPVRNNLVLRIEDWKWSSAGWHNGDEPNSLEVDRIPPEWAD